ncbi:hypothetical protein [Cyanobium gracile]|nr:hypothetical protein [Cyanobium gracile]
MQDAIKAVQDTPIPNLLIAAGLLFLLLGFVNKLGGFIEVSPEQKKLTIPIGLLVLTAGLVLSMRMTTLGPIGGHTNGGEVNPPPIKPETGYVRATTNDPNPPTSLRNGPGSDYAIVVPIQKDEIFFVDLQGSGDWLPARTADNKNGYIYRPLVRLIK